MRLSTAIRRTLVLAGIFGVGMLCPTASHAQVCGGDCDGDGEVRINELVLGVNIALGLTSLDVCEAMDGNGGGDVTVDELVTAVRNALNGCPVVACEAPEGGRCVTITPGPGAQEALLGALLEAEPHDVIFLEAGQYDIDDPLSLDVDHVTIRGAGMHRTVLSFRGQSAGGEGLLVRGNDFTIEDIGLEDGPGDLLKVLGADGVTMRRVRAEWTNGPDGSNGSYGLYPVQCRNVLIEDSFVRGASDAGFYVGQSRNIIVRRNRAEENVAGIEIENSTDADVYDNVATGNTGGILVFNLPGPQVQDGRRTRVFANTITANNTDNFAPGGTVQAVPRGTGAMIIANDQVEVFDNTFQDNDTTDIILISYNTARLFGAPPANNPDFDPFSETIFIHDNRFSGSGLHPPGSLDILVTLNGGELPLPSIIFDGDANADRLVDGELPAGLRTCVQEPEGTILNLNFGFPDRGPSKDLTELDCAHPPLSPVTIGGGRHIEIAPGPDAQDALLAALLDAQPGDDILIKAGVYELTEPLSLTVDHVTLRGEGMDQTILRFAGLAAGAQGLLVRNASDFTLRDLAIEDSPGDQFKAEGVDGLRVQRVRAEWTTGPDPANGSYGIYPVQCTDVLVEDSIARGASDTGIYAGQSRNIIIRRNLVELNVAGIEIENSTAADVYANVARNNAAGILVFNLPGLQVFGERTRVFDNHSVSNNTTNFAPEGNIVSLAPTGTGLLILANDQVEVFGNTFEDNGTSQVTVISYNSARILAGIGAPGDPRFDPYSEAIYLHDNTYIGGGDMPAPSVDFLVALIKALLDEDPPLPQIVVDGDVDPAKLVDGMLPAGLRTCIREPDATFLNLNVPTIQTVPNFSHDLEPFACELPRLRSVAIAGVQ